MRILIVGQGLAGTVLSWALLQRGAEVWVAEGDLAHPASTAAAGLINPVTGKLYVKTWQYDDFFPIAKRFYAEMEAALRICVWSDVRVLRLLDTPKSVNDWEARQSDPAYAGLLSTVVHAGSWQPYLHHPGPWGETRGAARVDLPLLLSAFRAYLLEKGLFLSEKISPEEITKLAQEYEVVIFCEGWRGALNPFFPNLPWRLTVGEALLVRLLHPNAASLCDVVKKNLLLIPLGDAYVWAGATYRHWFPSMPIPEPRPEALEKEVRQLLRVPFEVVRVISGIRPTVRDRRPLIGESSLQPNFFLFNGLGTKGALLAPYWAEHFASHLLEGVPLSPIVHIHRS
ncbi:MAG: FAD-binding oxidoreductase [Saprospiraceae bacterium]|nr:FAD-binding oxidoreductase [Saprospiraceae bacterium]MDW8483119.1 FAD-dependent oxidoreductase [Saprospiraceae bacterium]